MLVEGPSIKITESKSDLFLVLRQLRPYLLSRAGLRDYYHRNLSKAVRERYLGSEEQQRQARTRLADYFECQPAGPRKADELPWLLERSQEWQRLQRCLVDLELFLHLFTEQSKHELFRYWSSLGDRFNPGVEYAAAMEAYEASGPEDDEFSLRLERVGLFLSNVASYQAAEDMLRQALAIRQQMDGLADPSLAVLYTCLAEVLQANHRLRDAELFLRQAVNSLVKLHGENHLDVAVSLNHLALLFQSTQRYQEAEDLLLQAYTIDREVHGPHHPLVVARLINLAGVVHARGELQDAEKIYLAAPTSRRRQNHPSRNRRCVEWPGDCLV